MNTPTSWPYSEKAKRLADRSWALLRRSLTGHQSELDFLECRAELDRQIAIDLEEGYAGTPE